MGLLLLHHAVRRAFGGLLFGPRTWKTSNVEQKIHCQIPPNIITRRIEQRQKGPFEQLDSHCNGQKTWDHKIEKLNKPGVNIPEPPPPPGHNNNNHNHNTPPSPPSLPSTTPSSKKRNNLLSEFCFRYAWFGTKCKRKRHKSESDSDSCPESTTRTNTNKVKQACLMMKQQIISKK